MTTFNSKQLEAAAKASAGIDQDTDWSDCETWTWSTEDFAEAYRALARRVLEAAGFTYLAPPTPSPCPDHKPVQHRDGKPAWCNACGLTAAWQKPQSRLSSASCPVDADGCEP